MIHLDASGERLPSTNSQPSYVLWLLDLLDLRPGQRVLEIGSGSGWLAAVMAQLVGKGGHVTGMEIIPELAAQSQADLERLGIDNVSVLAADGAEGHAAGAPFDRVMITAASWDLPTVLFGQVTEGGRVLVPVELRGGGCQVTVLRRERQSFVAEQAVPGWFVPLLGPGQQRPALRVALAELPFWDEIGRFPPQRVPLPLAMGPDGAAGSAVAAFCAFLGRTAADFAIFGDGDPPEQRPWLPAEPFGILDQAGHSVALWSRGELLAYGGASAMRALAQAYANWTSCGLPGLAGFALQVVRIGSAPLGNGRVWTEPRGETALVWRLSPGAEDWKALLLHPDHCGALAASGSS
jgi:protein-L-isoaspartate(D-aspartate) O-methyltransferase